MTAPETITAVQDRLQRATKATAMLQRAGTSEQYLESYFLVEALELQLARLRLAAHPRLDPDARGSP
ncbi:hypothetical protein [Ramlibacter algicola]|uniref:Uncharacterized protein n=1 Tax=Ramlibacter algicola TaxID=2795217 RepID=A0A934USE1_9BURK|nr:hypothetical protein [Ramlibacter algicola]MBK0393776.1 hypothetical protein [Ramlibacter algicola]